MPAVGRRGPVGTVFSGCTIDSPNIVWFLADDDDDDAILLVQRKRSCICKTHRATFIIIITINSKGTEPVDILAEPSLAHTSTWGRNTLHARWESFVSNGKDSKSFH